jgi:hypothetical protein
VYNPFSFFVFLPFAIMSLRHVGRSVCRFTDISADSCGIARPKPSPPSSLLLLTFELFKSLNFYLLFSAVDRGLHRFLLSKVEEGKMADSRENGGCQLDH